MKLLKTIIKFNLILCMLVLFSSNKTYAQIIVEDLANLPHNILASVEAVKMVEEQIKQYKILKEEFELIVKNSAAPYFYVYNEVQNFDDNVERLKQRFSKFSDSKEVDKYFKQYYDINWYRTSPCFKAGGCSNEDLERLKKQRLDRINDMTKISSNLKKDLTDWTNNQKARYERLKKLNNAAQKAEGHFEIQSYQAQYLSEMTQELIALNENMRKFQSYMMGLNGDDKLQKDMMDYARSEKEWITPKIKKFQLEYIGRK